MTGTTPPDDPTDEVWAESFELVIDLLVGLEQRLDRLESSLSRLTTPEPEVVSLENGRGNGHPHRSRAPRRLVAFLRR